MKVNTKIRYGLRTVIEIAKSTDPGGVLQKDIAENQQISIKYLDSIISSLKVKGIIANVKGKGQGYRLTRPAEEITVWDIYTAFEPITMVDCIENESFCDKSSKCCSRDYWIELREDYSNLLKAKTLAQILEKAREKYLGKSEA